MDRSTTETTTTAGEPAQAEVVDGWLLRRRRERQAALERLQREARETGRAMQQAVNADAAEALREALEGLRANLLRWRQTNALWAVPMYGEPPSELRDHMHQAHDAADSGERAIVIDVTRPDRYGTRGWRRSQSWMYGATSGASSGDGR